MGMFGKKTIFLVVDDFEPMRKITEGQLRMLGASTILVANNGADALRILKNQRVDIVLSDWNMPVMAGLELLKEVRADKKLSSLPFIMITAEAARARIQEAIGAGVSDLLVKPYTAERFAAHIEKVLSVPQRPSPSLVTPRRKPLDPKPVPAVLSPTRGETLRPCILLVDDTPDNLLLLAHLLEDEYRIRIAHSGDKALEICASSSPPDLVLLDIMMPGMDGFEVARRMREHPTSEHIPVIFVTAMSDDDARLQGMELGAVDFISKPINPQILKPRVRNFMRYVELQKHLQADYDGMLELARLREDVDNITRHDMKGPLAGVIGLVQALATDQSISRKQVGQLRLAEEAALQVLNMINLSSELFKIETGRFTLDARPVKIGHLLHRIVEISRSTFSGKNITIAVDTDVPTSDEVPTVRGDEMLCYSLFQNLIKNACEAAPENSRVNVTLKDEAPIRVIIQNNGAVPGEIRESFFGKFVTCGKQGGSGLGTYSAKRLAEAQNGSIAMKTSDAENKTTITVILPRFSGKTP